jgi:predicted enzyme related to lactoylglutathione lyase
VPEPPVFDPETVKQLKELVAKGVAGSVFFATDDIKETFADLRTRGVEFVQEPQERPYGIDAGIRDPSGNQLRVAQLTW